MKRGAQDDDPFDDRTVGAEDVWQPLLQRNTSVDPPRRSIDGVVIGELIAIESGAESLVCYDGRPGSAAVSARSVVDLTRADIGRSVLLIFEDGDPAKPIVLGLLGADGGADESAGTVDPENGGRRAIVAARERLVLRCGDASITLTHAGKVLIQGAHISSDSSGVNRIKGGSVQIN